LTYNESGVGASDLIGAVIAYGK